MAYKKSACPFKPSLLVQLKALGLLIFSISVPVLGFIYIFMPPQNYDQNSMGDIFLEGPAGESGVGMQMPVVSMRFFPSIDDKLDASISGVSYNLSFMRSKVDRLDRELVTALNSSSTYKGYQDKNAENYLDYKIVKSFEFLEPAGDYSAMLSAEKLEKSICDYVDKDGIKEFWIWTYAQDVEFNLAMGEKSQKFWNKKNSGSISSLISAPDLPTCTSSYTVYEYNWNQETEDALSAHARDLEAILKFVDEKDSPLFWGNFVGADATNTIVKPGCGWSDMPPNAIMEGDYGNQNSVLSDCMDWTPDGTGGKQPISCSAWGCSSLGFYTWYLQNIPGKDNSLMIENRKLRNWWEFIADFDYAISGGKNLTTVLLANSPQPSVLGESIVVKTVTINVYFLKDVGSAAIFVNSKKIAETGINNRKAVWQVASGKLSDCNQGCELVLKTPGNLSLSLGRVFIPKDSDYILEFTAKNLVFGDLNNDGIINAADIVLTSNTEERQIIMQNYGKTF